MVIIVVRILCFVGGSVLYCGKICVWGYCLVYRVGVFVLVGYKK